MDFTANAAISVMDFGTFRVGALLERKREARSDKWVNRIPHVGDNGRSRFVGELSTRLCAWEPPTAPR